MYFSNDVSDIPENQYSATAYDANLNELGYVHIVNINSKYIELDGDYSASGLTECYIIFDNDAYNTDELGFGDVNPGDNLAWTGDHWDELAGITDLSGYATKEEVNSKLSTVYKYKGTVNTVNNLPTSNQVGDVYNVKTSGTLTETILGYPCEVTGLYYGPMFDGTEFFGNLPGGTSGLVNVYAPNKEFIAQIDHSTIDDGVFRIPGKDYTSELSEGTYYLEFLDNPIYNYDLVKRETICTVVGGDNVAWDGTTWDVLAGTEDLSIYATKDEMNSKLSSVYRYKGTVNTVNDLPISNRVIGDVYNVKNSNPRVINTEYVIPVTVSDIQVIDQTNWIQTFCIFTFTDNSVDLSHIFSKNESDPDFELYYKDGDDIYKTISTSVMTYTQISDNSIKCEFMNAPGYGVNNLAEVVYLQAADEVENTEKGSVLIKVDRTVAVPLTAGDNIAWTGSEWDLLAGITDLSDYVTEDEMNSKISSVYKYKGTVADYTDLPSNAEIGEVWNIENETVTEETVINAIPVTEVTGVLMVYISYDKQKYPISGSISNIIGYDKDFNIIDENISVGDNGDGSLEVFEDGNYGELKYFQVLDSTMEPMSYGETFVFEGAKINAGANVAWTGSEWDVLAGTVNLSGYAEKADTLSGYGIIDAYTKTEVDSKLSSVYKYKGTKNTVGDLPINPVSGDVWNIKNASKLTDKVIPIIIDYVSIETSDPLVWVEYTLSESLSYEGSYEICMYDSRENPEVRWVREVGISGNTIRFAFPLGEYVDVHNQYSTQELESYLSFVSNQEYGTYELVLLEARAGDNVAWSGGKWDVLAGIVDLTNYATKTELDTKLSSIYKYKGTVTSYENLPIGAEIGDVWNVETSGTLPGKTIRAIPVTSVNGKTVTYDGSKYPISTSIDHIIGYDNEFNVINEDITTMDYGDNTTIEIDETGNYDSLAYFQVIDTTDMSLCDYGQDYVLSGITINSGDNVAWTGEVWDKLAGTIDLSAYATKEEVSGLVSIREATFEEIDAALDDMTASYTTMKTLTEEIIAEQNALIGGTE